MSIMVGGLGTILVLSGIIIDIAAKRKNKQCTEKPEGTVVQYRFPGEGRMYPIVEYFAYGACYRAKKKFRGVKTKKTSGLPIRVQSIAYEDEEGRLHVKIGPIANLRQLAEQLWPLGSKMTVYYNPKSPKKCYVDRPVSGSFVTVMFIIMGFVTIPLGLMAFP